MKNISLKNKIEQFRKKLPFCNKKIDDNYTEIKNNLISLFYLDLKYQIISSEDFVSIKDVKGFPLPKGYNGSGNLFHLLACYKLFYDVMSFVPTEKLSKQQMESILSEPSDLGETLPYFIATNSEEVFCLKELVRSYEIPPRTIGKLMAEIHDQDPEDPSIATYLYKADRSFAGMMQTFDLFQVRPQEFLKLVQYKYPKSNARPLSEGISKSSEAFFNLVNGFLNLLPSAEEMIDLVIMLKNAPHVDPFLNNVRYTMLVFGKYAEKCKEQPNQRFIEEEKVLLNTKTEIEGQNGRNKLYLSLQYYLDAISNHRDNRLQTPSKVSIRSLKKGIDIKGTILFPNPQNLEKRRLAV
jgi:hypothetical protein